MESNEKQRNATSAAVIELRKALGMTQQRLAVEVLHSAVTTVARYETSNPPQGDALLRVGAAQKALDDVEFRKNNLSAIPTLIHLRDTFKRIYIEGALENIGFQQLVANPANDDSGPDSGYLLLKLETNEEFQAAACFYGLIHGLRSTETKRRKAARLAAQQLQASRRDYTPLFSDDMLKGLGGK